MMRGMLILKGTTIIDRLFHWIGTIPFVFVASIVFFHLIWLCDWSHGVMFWLVLAFFFPGLHIVIVQEYLEVHYGGSMSDFFHIGI